MKERRKPSPGADITDPRSARPAGLAVTLAVILLAGGGVRIASAADEHGHGEAGHQDEHGHGDHDEGGEHADEVQLSPEAVTRYGVTVAKAALQPLARVVTAPGRVTFNLNAYHQVGALVSGRVVEFKAQVGEPVAKGDALLVIDSPEFGEAQAEFRTQRAAAHAARAAFDRGQSLAAKSQGISVGEVQKREAEWRAAESAAAAAESRLKSLGLSPDRIEAVAKGAVDARYVIRSPLAGTVVERSVVLGELVGPDKNSLCAVSDVGTLWVLASVPEAELAEVAPGFVARVKVPAYPEQSFDGRLTFVSPALNEATRTAEARIEVADPTRRLKPAMFAQVHISPPPGSGAEVLAVPATAVMTVEGGPAVFVPVPDEANTFAKRAVTVAPAVAGMVPVLSGLAVGEEVVVGGAFVLKAELGKAGAAHEH